MDIKIVFHALAIASGIIAGACALLSSQNKIALFVCFSVIAGAFELTILFLQTYKFSPPEITYSLQKLLLNYKPGIEVDGVKRQDDFEEYLLKIENKSKKIAIQDVRVDMDIVGGIVSQSIFIQQGCENITYSSTPFLSSGIGSKKMIINTFKTYSNNLKINTSKIFPEGYFEFKIIIKTLPMIDKDNSGYFKIEYSYSDQDNDIERKTFPHKILLKNKKSMYIDNTSIISGPYRRSMGMIPEKPLIFKKNGKVEIKEEK